MEDQKSHGRRIAELAAARPDERALCFSLLDGTEPAFTWRELHERSSKSAARSPPGARAPGTGSR
ncbi:hypothetical protein [Actinomadura sp. CNU-125]|uniref:hypothetical protein n=1 Tax=Actinomadura sp. CNU-125 TaxID=1904961 RepID=UPI0021CC6097|nr:hypothetical protein [Actinomadura sp. CNU-125]